MLDVLFTFINNANNIKYSSINKEIEFKALIVVQTIIQDNSIRKTANELIIKRETLLDVINAIISEESLIIMGNILNTLLFEDAPQNNQSNLVDVIFNYEFLEKDYDNTDYQVVAHFGSDFTLCRFDLQTGRTHQIRVHAKHMGHPIVADPVYGYKKQKIKGDGQLLHAFALELTHPTTGEKMTFNATLPPAFAEILTKLCRQYGVEKSSFSYLFE